MGIFNVFTVIPMMMQIFTLPLFRQGAPAGRPEKVMHLARRLPQCAAAAALFVRLESANRDGARHARL